jgi:hypothetical protein
MPTAALAVVSGRVAMLAIRPSAERRVSTVVAVFARGSLCGFTVTFLA